MITGNALKPTAQILPKFTYTGNYVLVQESIKNWKIKFLTSGTLRFQTLGNGRNGIDVFVVGGGGGGSAGGGGGGYTNTDKSGNIKPLIDTNYTITIGAGGTGNNDTGTANRGGTTSAFNTTANGGYGGKGGSGAGRGGDGGSGGGGFDYAAGGRNGGNGAKGKNYSGGTGQGRTTGEFGVDASPYYAGGGASIRSATSYDGGGNSSHVNGTANTGGGGGPKGTGGSGIAIIRNHR